VVTHLPAIVLFLSCHQLVFGAVLVTSQDKVVMPSTYMPGSQLRLEDLFKV
jgi:hypothetical protein